MKEVGLVAVDDISKTKGLGFVDEVKLLTTIDVMAANYEMPRKVTPAEIADATVVPAALGR
jgi:hypothetical protein